MFRNIKRDGHEAKTLYRSHAVAAFNQHRQRKMYPLPEELSKKYKKGKNQRWWFHEQRTHVKDVWPKLLHYRVSCAELSRRTVADMHAVVRYQRSRQV